MQKSYNLAVVSCKSPKQQVLQGNVLSSGMKNKWQRDMAEPMDINVQTSAKNASKEIETDPLVL